MAGPYDAIIIGAGRIGAAFGASADEASWSHACAWQQQPEVRLRAVVDQDPARAEAAAARWDTVGTCDLDGLLEDKPVDIVSVCVPDHAHAEVLDRVLTMQPRLVIAEKPIADTLAATERIVAAYESAGVGLAVNLTRRYDERFAALARRLEGGAFGRSLHATLRYTKGILHNGIHAVDAALALFGACSEATVLGTPIIDDDAADPTLHAHLACERCDTVVLLGGDERAFSIFEIDILTEKGRIVFDRFGLQVRIDEVREDPLFAGYRDLAPGAAEPTALAEAMGTLAGDAVAYLEEGRALRCDGRAALAAEAVCHELRSAARRAP